MTIKKGQDWGTRAPLPDRAPIVTTDRELASLFEIHDASADHPTLSGPSHVGLEAALPSQDRPLRALSNLAKTVSARANAEDLRNGDRTHLPIDLAIVTIDAERHVLASGVVIHRRFWSGVTEAAMNTSFLGAWNVAPSGHPNDGRLDVITAELSAGDRWKARTRIRAGTHIPHPKISNRRKKAAEFTPDTRATIWLDGINLGPAKHVAFVVIADATTVVI